MSSEKRVSRKWPLSACPCEAVTAQGFRVFSDLVAQSRDNFLERSVSSVLVPLSPDGLTAQPATQEKACDRLFALLWAGSQSPTVRLKTL